MDILVLANYRKICWEKFPHLPPPWLGGAKKILNNKHNIKKYQMYTMYKDIFQ